jgi:hypothetical protein
MDFYRLYIDGRLRDEEVEEIDEFGRWAAFIKSVNAGRKCMKAPRLASLISKH